MTTMMKETHKRRRGERVSARDPFADDGARAPERRLGSPRRIRGRHAGAGGTTLEQTPTRMVSLLRGIGMIKPVREVLRSIGYTTDEHARGWALLRRCSGFVGARRSPSGRDLSGDPAAIAANGVPPARYRFLRWSTITARWCRGATCSSNSGSSDAKAPARKGGEAHTVPRKTPCADERVRGCVVSESHPRFVTGLDGAGVPPPGPRRGRRPRWPRRAARATRRRSGSASCARRSRTRRAAS